jgi:VanZ family protein
MIFVLSSQAWLPGPPGGLTDKHGHALTFGVLTLACLFGMAGGVWQRVTGRMAVLAMLLAVVYGVSDEWHQSFVPGRMADAADVAADAAGAVVAAGLGWAWAILLRRRARRS